VVEQGWEGLRRDRETERETERERGESRPQKVMTFNEKFGYINTFKHCPHICV